MEVKVLDVGFSMLPGPFPYESLGCRWRAPTLRRSASTTLRVWSRKVRLHCCEMNKLIHFLVQVGLHQRSSLRISGV